MPPTREYWDGWPPTREYWDRWNETIDPQQLLYGNLVLDEFVDIREIIWGIDALDSIDDMEDLSDEEMKRLDELI